MSALAKRGIPDMSPVMARQLQSDRGPRADRKRRRLRAADRGSEPSGDVSSSEGEVGLEYNMEFDSWGTNTDEDDVKWNMVTSCKPPLRLQVGVEGGCFLVINLDLFSDLKLNRA